MNNGSGSGLATELERVREALAEWRATPGKGQRIPDALWRKAVHAAKGHGLNPVSKALGLDYNCLKKHAAESGGNRKKAARLPKGHDCVSLSTGPWRRWTGKGRGQGGASG